MFVLHARLTCFPFVSRVFICECTSCSREHVTGFMKHVFESECMFIAALYGYLISVCVKGVSLWSCVMCWCISLENQLFQRERERETGGTRHLHPRGRWMEEGRDGHKQRQRRQGGSVERDGRGGKMTPLHDYTYSNKTNDPSYCKAQTSHPAFLTRSQLLLGFLESWHVYNHREYLES